MTGRARLTLLLAAGCAASLAADLARADAEDTLNLRLAESVAADDNLFRLPAGVVPPASLGNGNRRDRVTVDSLSATFDKSYSLQRFHAEVGYANYHYGSYHFLDYAALSDAARWNWALTPRLTGNLSVDRQQSLNSFADFRDVSQRNLKTTSNQNADVDYWSYGAWHLVAGGYRNRTTNEVAYVQGGDIDHHGGQVGARYLETNGSFVTLQSRASRGLYPHTAVVAATLTDAAFRQVEHELLWAWNANAQSQFKGRITHLDRYHANFAVRDFGGQAGSLEYAWLPTAKLELHATATRGIDTYQATNASYVVTDTLSLAPSWRATEKLLAKLKLERIARDYRGNPGLAPGTRADLQRSGQLSLDWTPMRALQLTAAVQRDRRRSTATGYDYDDTTASLTAQFSF